MYRKRFVSLLLALLLLPIGSSLRADTVDPAPGELTVYLLTMDHGDAVWEKFGHNAIWIRDRARGTDRVYNYGVFDFHSPGYWSRFVKGDWIYQIAASDIYNTVRQYRYLNRTVTAQELALTQEQARELQEFLEWNLRPENAEYLYDYYRDNCSTRVRDALDRVLGGALRRATEDQPSGTTYRWHSRRLLQGDVAPYTGIALALGTRVDRPITLWEEMFLPSKLRERVRELTVPAEDGRMVPLVRAEEVLVEAIGRAPEADAPRSLTWRYLVVGVGVGLLILAMGWVGEGRGIAGVTGRVAFSLLAGGWSLVVGFAGLLIAGLWFLTNHTFTYYNENLLQATPFSLLLTVLLPALAFRARWAARPALGIAAAVAIASVAGALLQLLPWFDQVNGEIVALLLPPHLAIALATFRLRRALYSPPADTSADRPVSRRSIAGGR